MSLIHQNLYQGEDLVGVDTKTYFEKLTESLLRSYNVDQESITLNTDVEDMTLNVDILVPLALITNELISNSLKHAFPDKSKGHVYLGFRKEGDDLVLEQSDNGKGFDPDRKDSQESFGYQLIRILSQKLRGNIQWRGEGGFHFTLRFPENPENG